MVANPRILWRRLLICATWRDPIRHLPRDESAAMVARTLRGLPSPWRFWT